MIKYEVPWIPEIRRVEVERETDSCVFIKAQRREMRRAKRNDWGGYFDSWKDAHDYILEKVKNRVSRAEKSLCYEEELLEKVLGMKEIP